MLKEDDVNRLQKLMARITREGKFEMKMNEFVELFNEMDWINKSLIPTLRSNIMEIKSVKQITPEPKKPGRK